MATIKLKLDKRRSKSDGKFPVQLLITLHSKSTTISTGVSIKPEYWNGEVTKAVLPQCPNARQINIDLEKLYFAYSNRLRELESSGKLYQMNISEVRNSLTLKEDKVISFNRYFEIIISHKDRPTTAIMYRNTLDKVMLFMKHEGRVEWLFNDVTFDWLNRFERFLKTQHLDDCGKEIEGVRQLKANSIAIHFRNIRAVVNAAINEELTTLYPFRKFKIKQEETIKRSLTVEELRTLRDFPCEPHHEKYRDLFMLILYLIGINTIDLFNLTEVHNGRIEYRRSKTGRILSIKVEPEAQAILEKYRGQKYLLDVLDTNRNYLYFTHRMNDALGKIGKVERKGLGGKKYREPLFPKLTTYWARHTWATLAAELDIPDETISLALGHSSGNRVTNIYIKRNLKKVDAANRKVIDYLLGRNCTEGEHE